MSKYRTVANAALALILTVIGVDSFAQRSAPSLPGCGGSYNSYGPFDYRTAHPQQRAIVENRHFTYGIERLSRAASTDLGGNIDYTIAVFPNHARAIKSMERLAEKEKSDPPAGAAQTVECYYGRGMAFAPDDLVFRMLYVDFLIRRNRFEDAAKSLDYVVTEGADNPLTQYNAGLLYFDMKDYDKALIQAHHAQAMGMKWPELQNRLKAVGRWKDAETPPAADTPASAASAASAVPDR